MRDGTTHPISQATRLLYFSNRHTSVALALALLPFFALCSCRKESAPSNSSNPPSSSAQSTPRVIPDNTLEVSPSASETRSEKRAVKADIHNVMFRLTANASAHLENLSGELLPVGKNEMPVFDDKTSFELHVTNGTISISPSALAEVMNTYTFARDDAPLKDISAEITDNRLVLRGKLHSKKDLPFETAGEFTINSDGRLRLRTEKVKALHVPVKKVMSLFGIELAGVINTSKIPGLDTDKNDLLIDLGELLPAPHIRGRISSARLSRNQITVVYGDGDKDPPELAPGNYMVFRGNKVKFGRLVMDNTDLYLLDLDPKDPLDWFQERYKEQLVEGYSQITEQFGLRTYVKDYSKLNRHAAPAEPPATPEAPATNSPSTR
jgi:hypothetical protein